MWMGKTVKSKKGKVFCDAENISQFKNIFQKRNMKGQMAVFVYAFSQVSYYCKIYGSKIQLL